MNRKLTIICAALLLPLCAFAQSKKDDVTAKEIINRVYSESDINYSGDRHDCKNCTKGDKCTKSDAKKCAKCKHAKAEKDEYIPICREDAEKLITEMIIEARAPYVKEREADQLLQRYKIETLKRRLLDQALRKSYTDEYKDRLDRMENLLTTMLLSNNGNLDPNVVAAILGNKPAQQVAPNTATNLTDGQVVKVVNNGTIEDFLAQVYFEVSKHDLSAESQNTLDTVVKWMNENPNVHMTLRGYASPEGNLKYNNALSGRRVNAVADYLVSKGISRNRLEIIPSGIDSIKDTWPEARRVDLKPVLCD